MAELNITDKYVRIIAIFLGFFAVVLGVYVLIVLKGILVPIIIAVFLAVLLAPVLHFLERIRIPRRLGVVILLIVLLGLQYLVSILVTSSMIQLSSNLPFYGQKVVLVIQTFLEPYNITAAELAAKYNIRLSSIQTGKIFQEFFNRDFISYAVQFTGTLLQDIFLVTLFWTFMIAGKAAFDERFKSAFEGQNNFVADTIRSIIRETQNYFVVKSLLNLIMAFILTIYFISFGSQYAILWGTLSFFLHFIPSIGSILVVLLPGATYLLHNGLTTTSVIFLVGLALFESYEGNVFEPKFIGKRMNLSPVFVLISLVFWGWVWGIVGMFLAVPIASSLRIACSNIEVLKPYAVLMGGGEDESGQLGFAWPLWMKHFYKRKTPAEAGASKRRRHVVRPFRRRKKSA